MCKPDQGDSLKRSGVIASISGQDGTYQVAVVGVPGTGAVSGESYYVEDAAKVVVFVAERYDESNQDNMGSGEKIRIRGFTGLAVNLMVNGGRTGGILANPHERPRRMVDATRTERACPLPAAASRSDGLSDTSRSWERRSHHSTFPAGRPGSE